VSIDEGLHGAEQPLGRWPMPFRGRREELGYRIRMLLPVRARLLYALLMGHLDRWRDPRSLAEARELFAIVLAGTERAPDVERVARRRLIEDRMSAVMFWRRSWANDRTIGIEVVKEARASGRGAIYSFIHLGAYQGVFAPVHRLGIKTHFPVGPWLTDAPEDNEWGLRVEHWRRRLEVLDVGTIPLKGSYEVLRALLEQRKLVMIAFDMPGSYEIDYLGKPVMLASGTANLAFQTDSVVIPAHRIRHGLGYTIEIGAALDPREAESPLELTQQLAAVHERRVLNAPEGLEDPTRPGAWEDGVSASAWRRPSR
jgi:hypothetical protein